MDVQQNKVVAVLAYLSILFFLPLVVCPGSPYGRFHANQALLLLLAGFASEFVCFILLVIFWPLIFLIYLVMIALVVFMIIGMVSASKGEMKDLPLIGKFRLIK